MNDSIPTILIADDEAKERKVLSINLKTKYKVLEAQNGNEALELIEGNNVHLVLTDLKMPGMNGLELLKRIKKNHKNIPVILLTAFGSINNAVEAMKRGALDYITKPVNLENLEASIEKALNYGKLLRENIKLKEKIKKYEGFNEIITVDPKMKNLMELIVQVANTPATILIEGESGTGKMLFANAVHNLSNRSNEPFVEINCGAIPHDLLESELFGHERGAFTGAVSTKKGKFELADGGTLFLDEIGELPLDLQVKLLHVIEKQKFTRVGGTKFLTTNARIVSATNKNLKNEVANNNFRQDLYFRLKVIYLKIPPLRERKEDIPLLIDHFIKKYKNLTPIPDITFSEMAIKILTDYNWPGNIRELENIVQQSIIFTKNNVITEDDLPSEIVSLYRDKNEYVPLLKDELQKLRKNKTEKIIDDLERKFLVNLLKKTKGNITSAAEISGYNRRQLQNFINKHSIDIKLFR